MDRFIKDVKIKFSREENESINKEIEKFVTGLNEKNQSIRYYAEMRNTSDKIACRSSCEGKKGEFGSSHILKGVFGLPLVLPDTKIYTSKKKNWDCDLPYHENGDLPPVHVKSCTAFTLRFVKDYSWSFNWGNAFGGGGKDKLFKAGEESNDMVALMYMENWDSDEVIMKAFLPWKEIKPLLRDPLKKDKKSIKKCLYFKDLK